MDNLIAYLEVVFVGISARPLGPILAGRHTGPVVKGATEAAREREASLRGDGSNPPGGVRKTGSEVWSSDGGRTLYARSTARLRKGDLCILNQAILRDDLAFVFDGP